MKLKTITRRSSTRGFSLTEISVVLTVMAIIVGGVWAVSADITNSAKQEKFTELMRTTVTNVRGIYAGTDKFNAPGDSNAATMTKFLIDRNVFPSDSIRKVSGSGPTAVYAVNSPFGGNKNSPDPTHNSFYVCGWGASGSTKCLWTTSTINMPLFAVEAVLAKGRDCVGVVMRNSSSQVIPGFVALYINGNLIKPNLSLKDANTACNDKNLKVNIVDFVYQLKP